MSHTMTAEELLNEMKAMPSAERSRFFALLGARFFEDGQSQPLPLTTGQFARITTGNEGHLIRSSSRAAG